MIAPKKQQKSLQKDAVLDADLEDNQKTANRTWNQCQP